MRLLEKGGLVRKAPLATGARVLGCREEETWEEGILEEVREVRTAEEVDTLTLEEAEQAGGATSPSRGGDRTNREKGDKKFKPYTLYT